MERRIVPLQKGALKCRVLINSQQYSMLIRGLLTKYSVSQDHVKAKEITQWEESHRVIWAHSIRKETHPSVC